jgi:hypothetical protein
MQKALVPGALICLSVAIVFQPAYAQKTSPRTEAFLKMAESATSFESLALWFGKQNYTDAEKRALADLVSRSPLSKKLQALYDAEGRKAAQTRSTRVSARTQQAKTELARRRRLKLADYRAKAASVSGPAKKPLAVVPLKTMAFSPEQMRAGTARPSGPQARIDELDPAPPLVVGRRFNIIGSNLGTARGRVVLIMASLSHRGRADILDCRVDRWGTDLIQVTIPELAEAWLAGREKTGVIWAKLAGGETGPLQEARIAPDFARIVPQITRLSSETIEPGAVITITGEDFCASPEGSVTFTLMDSGQSFGGDVELWSDTAIRVVMPDDIEGVQPQRCRLEVTNHLGNRGERVIDFDPIWQVETLTATHQFDHTFAGSNFILMWFGETGTFTDHDLALRNGWKVVRSYIECGGNANHGCEHRAHPSEGDTRCASTVFIWCDGFARVFCSNYVEITGPKGIPYR